MKKENRDIKYGVAPKALVEAIRKQLREMVETPDLDQRLGEIGRFAHQADDMLMCVKSPEAVMKTEHSVTVPGAPATPQNAETYGATIVRQIMSALVQYQNGQKDTPEALAFALVTARRAGMTDVAAELELKLLGKRLDGDRPISNGVGLTLPAPTIAHYLPPPRCMKPIHEKGKFVGLCGLKPGHKGRHKETIVAESEASKKNGAEAAT